jgi:organic radical activating enzyme
MKYIAARKNLALTIFVPWNCTNNCPFCTSKCDYYDNKNFSLKNIIKSLKKLIQFDKIHDIVLSGGEPLADLDGFEELLYNIYELNINLKKPKYIFINTTLPKTIDENKFDKIINKYDIIDGFNVSRHIDVNFSDYINDELLYNIKLNKSYIRINSVISNEWLNPSDEDKCKIKNFIDYWLKYSNDVSFRWDYRKVKNMDDLKSLNNPFVQFLGSFLNYKSSSGCLVCNDDYFEDGRVHFHRGMMRTSIKFQDNLLINDIIIKQDGSVYLDWDSNKINKINLNNFKLE